MDADKWINGIIAILVAVVGLATTAVIFSTKAQTPRVIESAGTAFSQIIKAAVSPVTG